MSHNTPRRQKPAPKTYLPNPKAKAAYWVLVFAAPALVVSSALIQQAEDVLGIAGIACLVAALILKPFVRRCPYCGHPLRRLFSPRCPRCGRNLWE